MNQAEKLALAKSRAADFGIDPMLLCAVCEQESSWNEFAQRYEPDFMSKYVAPHFLKNEFGATEAYSRAMSWGLMQLMGQVSREQGFKGVFLAELCDPFNNLTQGCTKLKHCLDNHGGDVSAALLAYNGGGNPEYPAQVIARMKNYTEGI